MATNKILGTITVSCPVPPSTPIYFHISSVTGIGGNLGGSCVVTTYSDSGNTIVTNALNTTVTITVEFNGNMGGVIPQSGIINPSGSNVTINQTTLFSGGEVLASVTIASLSPTSSSTQTYIIN